MPTPMSVDDSVDPTGAASGTGTNTVASTNGTGGAKPSKGGWSNAIARRDEFIVGELDRLPRDALVVNVGCGVVRRFEPACVAHYLATDLRVLPNVDFSSDASLLPVADRSVDMVLALELLEHVPEPTAVLREIARVLKPGGRVIVSVPSTVPRHDDNDYWRFTAQGLERLGLTSFDHVDVHVFGGTFEALGYLAEYYTSLTLHVLHLPHRRLGRVFPSVGFWLDRRNAWSSSRTALHTLAFDLLFVGTAPAAEH
jgi:SAM-dependent methyltransferase